MRADSSVTEILRLTSPQARIITGLFIAVDLVLAIANLDAVVFAPITIVAVVLVTIEAIVITLPAPEPLPLGRTLFVLLLVATSTILANANLPPSEALGYAAWHLGANTLVLLFVGLRGRTGLAWVGFAGMVTACVV